MKPVFIKDIGQTIRVGYSGKTLGNTNSLFGAKAGDNFAKFMTYFPDKYAQVMPAVGGDKVIDIDGATHQELETVDYDAAITNNPHNLLVLMAADCIPLVFYSQKKDFVALAHVGTSGAASHLPSNVIRKLGTAQNELFCYVGPSISQKSYRFEKDKFEKKLDHTWDRYITDEPDGIHLNLLGYVLDELKNSGVKPENIVLENIDTGGDPNYFSHRRHRLTGETDGRNCFAVCLISRENSSVLV